MNGTTQKKLTGILSNLIIPFIKVYIQLPCFLVTTPHLSCILTERPILNQFVELALYINQSTAKYYPTSRLLEDGGKDGGGFYMVK